MTYCALSFPAPVIAASPIGIGPSLSHSAWIDGPPFARIAPATPPPRIRSLFAALTIASTGASVRSPLRNTILERHPWSIPVSSMSPLMHAAHMLLFAAHPDERDDEQAGAMAGCDFRS